MEKETSDEPETRSLNTDQMLSEENISQTIVVFSKPADPPLESTDEGEHEGNLP